MAVWKMVPQEPPLKPSISARLESFKGTDACFGKAPRPPRALKPRLRQALSPESKSAHPLG